jgi:uncharacterized membrane protein YecN with MAPEG domain
VDEMAIADPREDGLREQAVVRLRKKREFGANVLAYVMINTLLVTVWALTGAEFFWPIFPIMGWGIGIVFHAWDVYGRLPSEERIRREMERLRDR